VFTVVNRCQHNALYFLDASSARLSTPRMMAECSSSPFMVMLKLIL
jgi:hypothetical protein